MPSIAQTEFFRAALAPAYDVERSLGAGGHAVVYLARDVKHDRQVAIKVLRTELSGTDVATRFFREIKVAARLTHPNIVPLLDSGMVGGTPFYVMPFVEGESLRVRLERDHVLPLTEAVSLISEVADALHYAHAAGIVHRDIKPENILLLSGHAVVADFGVARALTHVVGDADRTSAGFILGTPAYMSPEQAAGDDNVDGRSDIYSLATVLYEMLSGSPPFEGKSVQALIAQRFVHPAPHLSAACPSVPVHVCDAIAAALSLETTDRPATAGAFGKTVLGLDPASAMTQGAHRQTATPRANASVISHASMPSIAVLPFANLSADPENDFLSDGITEEIISTLSRLRTIRVAARSSSFAFKGRSTDVRAVAEQLGVTNVLDGSVRRSGARVRVTATLVDATTGFQLWSDRIDRPFDDAFQIQDDIARAISDALTSTILLASVTGTRDSIDGAVYELYLRGKFALNKRTEPDLFAAVQFFEKATASEPEFALAHAGLADALLILGIYGARAPVDVMPRARDAAERALAIDPALGEAHATLGTIRALFDWDSSGAEDAFRRATALGPRDPVSLQRYSLNVLVPSGRLDEARAAIDRARALDPLSMVIATSVGAVYHLAGDTAGAIRALKRAIDVDAEFVMSYYFLGGALRDAGDLAGSAAAFEAAITKSGGTPEMLAGLAQTFARQGNVDAARSCQRDLADAESQRHVSPCLAAQVFAALGDQDSALGALERAAAERDAELVFVGVRSAYASLHGLPRFDALRKRIGV